MAIDQLSEKNVELLDRVLNLFDAALAGQNVVADDYEDNKAAYENERDGVKAERWCTVINANIAFRTIRTMTGKLTEVMPGIYYYPQGDNPNRLFASMMNAFYEGTMTKQNMDFKDERAVLQASLGGMTAFEIGWDPLKLEGIGDEFIRLRDPRSVFFDPRALWNDETCGYCGYTDRLSEDQLVQLFDVDFEDFGPDENVLNQNMDDRYQSQLDDEKDSMGRRQVLVIYMDDSELEDVPVFRTVTGLDGGQSEQAAIGPDGNPITRQVKVYPYGRVVICMSRAILADYPNPYEWGDPKWPIIPLVLIPADDRITGLPIYRYLLPIQDAFNELLSNVLTNARLTSSSKLFVEEDNGMDTLSYKNEAAEVIPLHQGKIGTYKYEKGPEMPQYTIWLMTFLLQLAERITGLSDALRGEQPGSVRTTSGIKALQQAASTGLRLQGKGIERTKKDIAKALLWIYQNHYTTPRKTMLYGLRAPQADAEWKQYQAQLLETATNSAGEAGEIDFVESAIGNTPQLDTTSVDRRLGEGPAAVKRLGGDSFASHWEVIGTQLTDDYSTHITPDLSSPITKEQVFQVGVAVQNMFGFPASTFFKFFGDVLPIRVPELVEELQAHEKRQEEINAQANQNKRINTGANQPKGLNQVAQGALDQAGQGEGGQSRS